MEIVKISPPIRTLSDPTWKSIFQTNNLEEQRKGLQQQQKNSNGIKARVYNLPAFVNHAAARNSCWVKSAHGNQSDLSVKLPSGVSSGTDGVSPLPSDVGMPRQAWKEVAHTLQGAASRGQIFLIFHHSLGISINKG